MNWRIIRAIVRKDLLEVRQNGMAWKPMVILPLIFVVVLPLIVILGPKLFNFPADALTSDPDLQGFLNNMPPAMKAQLDGLDSHQMAIVMLLGFMFAPMLLIIPVMVASVVGTESFVGEKERRTIEPLLYTPATERELFVGKMLAALLPALGLTWLSFLAYTFILNVVGAPVMGRFWFPSLVWLPMMLWVAPAIAFMGMTAAVLVSARTNTFMEAYQTTGMLVLPVILLVIGQATGVIYLNVTGALVIGLVLWLVDAELLWFALRIFSRARLMARV
ncbi:MAG: ABC transporter permease subunit [Chloroflexi bacterium]|nr:ABC transporter permease subunit [Chloroflexota bacterium]